VNRSASKRAERKHCCCSKTVLMLTNYTFESLSPENTDKTTHLQNLAALSSKPESTGVRNFSTLRQGIEEPAVFSCHHRL
jgi:hypothetical protein